MALEISALLRVFAPPGVASPQIRRPAAPENDRPRETPNLDSRVARSEIAFSKFATCELACVCYFSGRVIKVGLGANAHVAESGSLRELAEKTPSTQEKGAGEP